MSSDWQPVVFTSGRINSPVAIRPDPDIRYFLPQRTQRFDLLVKLHRLSELEMDLLRRRNFRFLRTPGRKSFQLVQAGNDHQLP
jgi:hypothetical protein